MSDPVKFTFSSLVSAIKGERGTFPILGSMPYLFLYVGARGGSIKYIRNVAGGTRAPWLVKLPANRKTGKVVCQFDKSALEEIKAEWNKCHAVAERGMDPTTYKTSKVIVTGVDSKGKKGTLRSIVEDYHRTKGASQSVDSKAEKWRVIRLHSGDFLDLKASSITTEDIQDRFDIISNKRMVNGRLIGGKSAADRAALYRQGRLCRHAVGAEDGAVAIGLRPARHH